MMGYWCNQEATDATIRDGWLWTGDLGSLDDEGYLTLKDRSKDVVISGGVNIYPREVEEVLLQHPDVDDVAVIGVPNEEFGEEVKAIVKPRAGAVVGPAFEADLIAECRRHLARYKCPRSVDVVDDLPRKDTGKLYKRVLRERYRTDTPASGS